MWRPLLAWPRARLDAWARAQGLAWIEDPANADPAHDRTHLRHHVLPSLRERWPTADVALARSAALCAQAADLLAAQDAATLRMLLAAPGPGDASGAPANDRHAAITVAALATLPVAARARALRAWVAGLSLPPLPASAITAIDRLLDARPDSAAEYRWPGGLIRAWRGQLHAMPQSPAPPLDWSLEWDGRQALPLPGGGSLALEGADAFDQTMRVHARRGGERMRLPGRSHSHALKHLLQDAGVPPWRRARMPLLSDSGGHVLAAGDQLLAAPLHDWLRERGARLSWRDLA
jgi:tRNA(Ile)-lysidine synthase